MAVNGKELWGLSMHFATKAYIPPRIATPGADTCPYLPAPHINGQFHSYLIV